MESIIKVTPFMSWTFDVESLYHRLSVYYGYEYTINLKSKTSEVRGLGRKFFETFRKALANKDSLRELSVIERASRLGRVFISRLESVEGTISIRLVMSREPSWLNCVIVNLPTNPEGVADMVLYWTSRILQELERGYDATSLALELFRWMSLLPCEDRRSIWINKFKKYYDLMIVRLSIIDSVSNVVRGVEISALGERTELIKIYLHEYDFDLPPLSPDIPNLPPEKRKLASDLSNVISQLREAVREVQTYLFERFGEVPRQVRVTPIGVEARFRGYCMFLLPNLDSNLYMLIKELDNILSNHYKVEEKGSVNIEEVEEKLAYVTSTVIERATHYKVPPGKETVHPY